jgi:hypothetical protein
MEFWKDPMVLAAGNARGLPGGDPDCPDSRTINGGTIRGTTFNHPPITRGTLLSMSGDLADHAADLGVDVATLVAARREASGAGQSVGGHTLLEALTHAFRRRNR